MASENKKVKGISLRIVYAWLIVVAIVVFVLTIAATYFLSSAFNNLSDASNDHVELEGAAHELMDASDYLTENVQRFTIDGDMRFLNEYFNEAFENNRREKAIEKMAEDPKSAAALSQLQKAMDASVELMDQEYYSMRLVIDAKGYTDYPEILNGVQLSSEDATLSAEDKMLLATKMVLNDDYYSQKKLIRLNMKDSLSELEALARSEENDALQQLYKGLIAVAVMSIIQTLVIVFIIVLTSHLGIRPVLKAVDKIKTDDPIPEIGANEFRYLARTYNKRCTQYTGSALSV